MIKRILFVTALLIPGFEALAADPFCGVHLLKAEQRAAAAREALVKEIRAKNIPAFLKNVGENKVPVVLMNSDTEQHLLSFANTSIGTELMAKAGWPNNHGSFRYGNNIIDAYMAGQRQVGETHKTGLSWKRIHDTNVFFDKIADVMVEVAYYVTPEEMAITDFYQKVRRAALYRVIFQMGDTSIYKTFDNVLSGYIYCFQYSKCSNIDNEAAELKQKAEEIEKQFGGVFQANPEVKQKFLAAAKSQLMAVDPYAGDSLNESVISSGLAGVLLRELTPPNLPERTRQLYANYLVGHQAAQAFSALRHDLNISNDATDNDQRNPRVTAILVYLKGDHAGSFRNANPSIGANGYSFNLEGSEKLNP